MEHKRFLLDIDTQLDFFSPAGSRYAPWSPEVAANIRSLFTWALQRQIPIISTVLRVRPSESLLMGPEPFCLEGTAGEGKLPGTIAPNYIDLGMRNSTDLPRDIFARHRQVIFEKRVTDIFSHPALERLVTEAGPAEYIICGTGMATGLLPAVLGLRHRDLDVVLATDAIIDSEDEVTKNAYRRMETKGAIFSLTNELIVPGVRRTAGRVRQPQSAVA